MSVDEERMLKLVKFTRNNSANEPYGCSIYDENGNLLVSTTGNKESPINHAEILAINDCSKQYPNIQWKDLTLYTTGEPCCMCTSACCWANLGKIIYATDIPFMIKLWNIESSLRAKAIIAAHPKKPVLIGNVCKEASDQLFIERKESFAAACLAERWL